MAQEIRGRDAVEVYQHVELAPERGLVGVFRPGV